MNSDGIDYDSLRVAVKNNIDERSWSDYDFDVILKSAKVCWDGTAVEVTSRDFVMVFDILSYEILSYTGEDIV